MKPRLFLDVDGVVLADYSLPGQRPCYQMRPYVGSFIAWASKHFELYWLTCHGPDSTEKICHYNNVLQFNSLSEKPANSKLSGITYAYWRSFEDNQKINLDKIDGIIKNGGLSGEWLVIEDNLPCYDGYHLINSQPDLKKRWITVPPQDHVDLFIQIQKMLEQYLIDKSINPPWNQIPVDESSKLTGEQIFTPEVLNELKK